MQNLKAPIGIFDSGVGGLSVLQEIKKRLPNESLIYLADQAFMPYGDKPKELLIARCHDIVNFFLAKGCKLVVIACNTATVYTLDELRDYFAIPIVGTVPAVKPMSRLSKTRHGAVLATPGTINSNYLDQLVQEFAQDMRVEKISGENLVDLIEKGGVHQAEVVQTLRDILTPYYKLPIDSLVLGCTHYPFLAETIAKLWPTAIHLIDSGEAIARRVAYILNASALLSDGTAVDELYTTADPDVFANIVALLLNKAIVAKKISLDMMADA